MNINPMEIIQNIRGGGNPQQLVMSILSQQTNNPLFSNLLNLAKNNQTADIEQIARNIMKERGVDFDKEFQAFKQSLGIK